MKSELTQIFEKPYFRRGIYFIVVFMLLLYSIPRTIIPFQPQPVFLPDIPNLYQQESHDYPVHQEIVDTPLTTGEYLVNNEYCKIYDMDPWSGSILKYFTKSSNGPKKCKKPIVTLSSGDKIFRADISNSKIPSCCFREIHRVTEDSKHYTKKADWKNSKSDCKEIELSAENGTKSTTEFVEIECTSMEFRTRRKLKNDYFAIVIPPGEKSVETKAKAEFWNIFNREQENEKQAGNETNVFEATPNNEMIPKENVDTKNNKQLNKIPPSILIVGIDSISRLHMIRSLPKTKNLLQQNDFIEMKGYTKIYDNTFPNVMGALLGQEPFTYSCWHNNSEKLDNCPFIWKNFSRNNYLTALIEDSPDITAFNYLKTGFVQQPTDYYMRPMAIAYKEKLKDRGCVGGMIQTEFMLKYLNDFIYEMRDKFPYFLFSWLTSIGHDSLNTLQTMDSGFQDLLSQAVSIGGENTVIIFMSDHGYRYGKFRETFLGFYEEALPFFFIRMPPSLKNSHPDWYSNLRNNSQRLTSPLDLHATLEDILSLSFNPMHESYSKLHSESTKNNTITGDNEEIAELYTNSSMNSFVFTHSNRQPGFRKIYSFFEETPLNRTCESSGIPQVYCRCGVHPGKDKQSKSSRKFGQVVIDNVNEILKSEIATNKCVTLKFDKFLYLRELGDGEMWNNLGKMIPYIDHLVGLEASPSGARFETKVRLFQNQTMNVVGAISRINKYEGQNECEMDFKLKPYCLCKDHLDKLNKNKPKKKSSKKTG